MVSIHAPARGATFPLIQIVLRKMFQSTHPHGVRLMVCSLCVMLTGVSIHAPARGATDTARAVIDAARVSIHAPARGATLAIDYGISQIEFQSTHPHGVRRRGLPKCAVRSSFNPRTRTGCDVRTTSILIRQCCFNPRTRTGCDFLVETLKNLSFCFNPRTRTGCDRSHYFYILVLPGFNPRTRTGCDFASLIASTPLSVSIHAPARGATKIAGCTIAVGNRRFNPRTRTGCDKLRAVIDFCRHVSIHAPARGATVYSAMS